jgi:hypothetical protein
LQSTSNLTKPYGRGQAIAPTFLVLRLLEIRTIFVFCHFFIVFLQLEKRKSLPLMSGISSLYFGKTTKVSDVSVSGKATGISFDSRKEPLKTKTLAKPKAKVMIESQNLK